MTESKRTTSIDLLRGAVMVLMALDHTRDFFGATRYEPTDLDHSNAPLFFTRWATHFCAPVFVFLAGTAAWLSRAKKSDAELARFLVSRGAWLVFLEITVVGFCWSFRTPIVSFTVLQVIWAIGWSMIVLSLLVRLPANAVAAIGGVIVAGHNLLDHIHPTKLHLLWAMTHERDFRLGVGSVHFGVMYPLVPWIGVMMLGFAFGAIFAGRSVVDRSHDTLRIGIAVTLFFLILRATNLYGDPEPWHARAGIGTLLSFLNCEKYPPSLCYLAMTLGPALMILALFDRSAVGDSNPFARAIVVYGRVPLFYYVLHIAVIHLASNLVYFARTDVWRTQWFGSQGLDIGLPMTYGVWAVVVVSLYPLCNWFAKVKASAWGRERAWLSYL